MRFFIRAAVLSSLSMIILVSGYRYLFSDPMPEDGREVMAQYGDYGDSVSEIQERLRTLGYYNGRVSGTFDLATAEAVKSFQEESGLHVSGCVNAETIAALGLNYAIDELITYEREQYIARVIDSVCPDSPYPVRVALAGVILKRSSEPGQSGSLSTVVFGDPSLREAYLSHFAEDPSEASVRAVRDAMAGLSPCPDALYFYRSNCEDVFLKRRPIVYRNSGYVFAS